MEEINSCKSNKGGTIGKRKDVVTGDQRKQPQSTAQKGKNIYPRPREWSADQQGPEKGKEGDVCGGQKNTSSNSQNRKEAADHDEPPHPSRLKVGRGSGLRHKGKKGGTNVMKRK